VAHAQGSGDRPAPEPLSRDYTLGIEKTPAGQPVQEEVSGGTMVMLAYGALWLIVLVYVVRLALQVGRLRGEMQELARHVAEKGGMVQR
jgi:CcmD family protein